MSRTAGASLYIFDLIITRTIRQKSQEVESRGKPGGGVGGGGSIDGEGNYRGGKHAVSFSCHVGGGVQDATPTASRGMLHFAIFPQPPPLSFPGFVVLMLLCLFRWGGEKWLANPCKKRLIFGGLSSARKLWTR